MVNLIRNIYRPLLLIAILALAGCGSSPRDSRLSEIVLIVSDRPEEALKRLGAICPDSLSDPDRHFLDFLTIKAQDKAYICHTSDSLILRLADYYESHPSSGLYPEVLYYAGRVYSDIGDYPTSLGFFQSALEALPDDDCNLVLKANIMAQISDLLARLRLYDEALTYQEKVLELLPPEKGSPLGVNDLQQTGQRYVKLGNYDKAAAYFREAIDLSEELPFSLTAQSNVHLADIEYRKGNIDNALRLIRHMPDSVDSLSRNFAMTTAAYIYRKAGIYDTVSCLAKEIVSSPDPHNRHLGYYLLLQPELKGYIDPDSIHSYINSYITAVEDYYDESRRDLGIIQQASYNYSIHEREKTKAIEERSRWKIRALFCGLIIALLLILILISVIRKKKSDIGLWKKIDVIGKLRSNSLNSGLTHDSGNKDYPEDLKLKDRFAQEIEVLMEAELPQIETEIVRSDVFTTLQALIKDKEFVRTDSELWSRLEELILSVSPEFKEKLQLFTNNDLRKADFDLAILMRCGFSTSQIAQLLQRKPSSISSRKESLSSKIFGKKGHTKDLDKLIRRL